MHWLIHPPHDLPAPKRLFPDKITASSVDEPIRLQMRKLSKMPNQIQRDPLMATG